MVRLSFNQRLSRFLNYCDPPGLYEDVSDDDTERFLQRVTSVGRSGTYLEPYKIQPNRFHVIRTNNRTNKGKP